MERTEKCYHYFIGLSIVLGISFIFVLLRLSSFIQNQSENTLHILLACKYSFMVGFLLSASITIALKCILEDLQWTLAGLKVDAEALKEKMKKVEIDR